MPCDECQTTSGIPTRADLAVRGRLLVDQLNHEEYELDGKLYVCGWRSPLGREADGVKGVWVVYEVTGGAPGPLPTAKVCPIMSYRSDPPVAVDCVRERCAAWFWPLREGEHGQGYCKLIGPGRQV